MVTVAAPYPAPVEAEPRPTGLLRWPIQEKVGPPGLVRIGPLGIGLQPEPVESGRPDLPVRALPTAEPEALP